MNKEKAVYYQLTCWLTGATGFQFSLCLPQTTARMTRRQCWINEICRNIDRLIQRTGTDRQKHCAPMMSRFRRTHWRRWWLPKRNQCRLSVCQHTWIHVLREATHAQEVSRKHHWTCGTSRSRAQIRRKNGISFYYLTSNYGATKWSHINFLLESLITIVSDVINFCTKPTINTFKNITSFAS